MQEKRTQQLQSFCQGLGIHMHDLELLDMALTHTSYAHEAKQYPKPHHNERIEFLGDSVLSLVVSTHLYLAYPEMDEGALSKFRAFLVLIWFAKALCMNMPKRFIWVIICSWVRARS